MRTWVATLTTGEGEEVEDVDEPDVEDGEDEVVLGVVEEGEALELADDTLETVEGVELVDRDDVKVLDDEEGLVDDGVPELALELPRDKKDDDVAEGHPVDDEQGVDVLDGHGDDVLDGVLHIVVFEME
ncbi:hypothetical protein KCU62_g4839, partial [Aureobasidium sp. EXF-3399]